MGRPQAAGRVWTLVLSASSWVSGLWLRLRAAPGAGECAQGQRVPEGTMLCLSLPLEAAPVPAKETLATGPRGQQARPCPL